MSYEEMSREQLLKLLKEKEDEVASLKEIVDDYEIDPVLSFRGFKDVDNMLEEKEFEERMSKNSKRLVTLREEISSIYSCLESKQ